MVHEDNGHLTPEDLAAYGAGATSGSTQDRIERHLTACDICRRDLIEASAGLRSGRGRRWVYVSLPTAAAAILAGLLLVPSTKPSNQVAPGSVLRGEGSEGPPPLAVIYPAQGDTISSEGAAFGWRSGGEGAYYRITVMDEGGDILWSATSGDTVIAMQDTISLEKGRTYFWYVDALLEGANYSTSGIQEFVTER